MACTVIETLVPSELALFHVMFILFRGVGEGVDYHREVIRLLQTDMEVEKDFLYPRVQIPKCEVYTPNQITVPNAETIDTLY